MCQTVCSLQIEIGKTINAYTVQKQLGNFEELF